MFGEMNIFLSFKNKNYEATYHENIDCYLTNVIQANILVVIIAVPFLPFHQYLNFQNDKIPFSLKIQKLVINTSIYMVLALVALVVWKARAQFKRHTRATRWIFDIFYNIIAGYLAYQFWTSGVSVTDPLARYLSGWNNCLMLAVLLSSISRWYMKLSAYLIVVLRIGISTYMITLKPGALVTSIQMVVLLVLVTYTTERDRKKHFIEKQKLDEETKVFREIFDETTEGVIIYGIREGMMFSNWSAQNYPWWNNQLSMEENLGKIILKGFKKRRYLPVKMALELDCQIQSMNHLDFWTFFENFTKNIEKTNSQELHSGNLMVLTGNTGESAGSESPTESCVLEIKIMYTIFKEKPALALIFSDITERNLVTVLQENNSYKDRLLASVSHELRTPLNASINFTTAAIEHPDLSKSTDVRENYLLPALRSNQLLLHLINDILDFSQMSANKLRLVYDTCNVGETLDECMNLIKIQATKKGIKLLTTYEFEDDKPDFCTDHNRLKQIVMNLLSNSLKFTLKGVIQLSAKIESDLDIGGRILKISVKDSGIGISDANKQKLFKAFEKIELGDRKSLNSQGVGLGLVISNNLVLMLSPTLQNNGIKVDSEVNKGATFSFWIVEQALNQETNLIGYQSEDLNSQMDEHLRDSERADTDNNLLPRQADYSLNQLTEKIPFVTVTSQPTDRIQFQAQQTHILVVDDDVFNISALEMVLGKLGFTCDTAYNGEQAIHMVQKKNQEFRSGKWESQYRLIFMDCNMPIMDGFEASRILKTMVKSGELEPIAIVACTAFTSEKEKQRAVEVGMDGYCIKPMNKEKVSEFVKKYLQLKG